MRFFLINSNVRMGQMFKKMIEKYEKDLQNRARRYCVEILPIMGEVRAVADRLECIIPEDMWNLPTYQEMLFNK